MTETVAENTTTTQNVIVAEGEGSILADFVQGDYKLSMWIPGDSAGRVVGKKGVVITNLQTETKAKQINALSAVGDSLWVAVVIIGDWKSINAAYKAVSDIVNGEVDDVVLEYHINTRKPFFIYGKSKTQVIKFISAKSAVRIFLPELGPKDQIHEKLPPMTLEGSFDSVKRAVSLLESEALSYRERHGDRKMLNKQDKEVANSNQKVASKRDKEEDVQKDEYKGKEVKLVKSTATTVAESLKDKNDDKDKKESTHISVVETKSIQPSKSEKEKGEPAELLDAHHEPPKIGDSPALSISKRMDIQKVINIPSSIVGLLLSKRPPLKATVMNQIQNTTNTIISKMISADTEEHQSARRKESIETIDTSTTEAKSSVLDDDGDDSSDDDGHDDVSLDSAAFEDTVEAPQNVAVLVDGGADKRKDGDFVVFRIIGFTAENVDVAFNHLDRIVKGERIKDVMESLKTTAKTLPRRDIGASKVGNKEYKDRDRRTLLERKPSKEKRSSFNKVFEKSSLEKVSEKEGLWRKEKLSDKPVVETFNSDRSRRPPAFGTSSATRTSSGEGRIRVASFNKESELKGTNPTANATSSFSQASDDSKVDSTKRTGKFVKRT